MASDDYRSRLIAARERLRLSRREMAKCLLTPRATYQQWEDGTRRTPGIAVVAAEGLTRKTMIATVADGSRTQSDIRKLLNISPQSVNYHLKRLGKSFRIGRPANIRAKVLPLCDGTRTIAQIAEIAGLTRVQVHDAIQGHRRAGKNVDYLIARPGRPRKQDMP